MFPTSASIWKGSDFPLRVVQSLFDDDGRVIDPKHMSWRTSLILRTGVDPLCCPYCGYEMYDVSIVYKIGNKLKVKYHMFPDDLQAIGYSGDERIISSVS